MANISSYNQLSNWNEDDDLLFVQQPDAPKKAHPSQIKEYILEGLDVPSVGGAGKYISAISEADGKISATAETMDEVPTQDSNKPVKSGGVFSAIDDSVSLKSATGNPITLTDAANANAEELLMTIEPIQSGSGDPSPTNVRPISGISEAVATRTGKNVFNLSTYPQTYTTAGVTHTINASEGTISFHRVSASTANHYYVSSETYKLKTGSYTLSAVFPAGITGVRLGINDASVVLEETGEVSFTLTDDTNISLYLLYVRTQSEDVTISDIMIRSASFTDSTFEPYTAANATITFGQTVYGGSVNFKTGEVTVTHGMVDIGTLSWAMPVAGGFSVNLTRSAIGRCDLICSAYPYDKLINYHWGLFSSVADKTLYRNDLYDILYFKEMSYSDLETFKTAMSGVQLCYELATPTTLTLTPAELELLKGNNTITANGAEISIEYYPDNAIGTLAGRVDTASEQIAGLTANTLIGIDISAYSSAGNQYTAPTDGYVRMELRNANQYFYLYVNNATVLGGEGHQVANANDYMTVFVRKGMKLYYNGTVQTAVFYSLT